MSYDYDPQSSDAMFSRILEQLKQVNASLEKSRTDMSARLDELVTESRGLGSRVTRLEHERWYQRGIVAAVVLFVAAGWEWVKTRFWG